MNYDEILKRLTEMLEKVGESAKSCGGNTWNLLVEAQKATALAGLVSAAIGMVFYVFLVRLAWRMAHLSARGYLAELKSIQAAILVDREKGIRVTYIDPSERMSVYVPGIVAVVMAVLAFFDVRYVWDTLPMAVAQYRHPAAFVAREAVERVVPPKKGN